MGDKLRAIDENFLTNRMLEDFKVYESNFDYVIVSDVRLVHELEYIKNNSKYDVKTMRVNANNSSKYLTLEQKSHHTETELDNYDKFDYIIENGFDDTLEEKVKEVIERMI